MRRFWHGRGDTLILLYHRVAEPDGPDPWHLCVPPALFVEHLTVLRRYSRQTLSNFVNGEGKSWRRQVVITFDDGYRDNCETALPLLEQQDWPAAFFLCTGPIAAGTPFWSDEFVRAFSGPAVDHLETYFRWQRMPDSDRQALLADIPRPAVPRSAYPMSPDDAGRLAKHPLVTIGAHTVTHPVLADLPHDQQEWELAGSKRQLEEWTDRSVDLLAYPYGGHETYSAVTQELARQTGFRAAVTTRACRAAKHEDVYTLPRWTVPVLNGDQFAEALTGLLGG